MKKIIVDFVAHTSVVVAVGNDKDIDDAIEAAEQYAGRGYAPSWEYEGSADVDDPNYEADVFICEECGGNFTNRDAEEDGACPYCGHVNY